MTTMARAMAACVLLACLADTRALAQEQPEFMLDSLVVTASRVQQKDIQLASSVEVIDAESIAGSGAGNAFSVLQHALGVTTLAPGPGGMSMGSLTSKVQVRGVDKGTLVLVDGAAINQDGKYNLEDIPADIIERIEIVRGGGAVLYGSEATGGVLNIITKKNLTHSSVKAAYGSFGQQRYAAQVAAGRLSINASAAHRGQLSNYADIAGDAYSYLRGRQQALNVSYKLNEAWTLTQSYAHNEHRVRAQRQALITSGNVYEDTDNRLLVQYDSGGWKGFAAYGTQEKEYDYLAYYNGAYVNTQQASWRKGHNLELDVQKSWELGGGDSLLVGANYKREDLDIYSSSVYTRQKYRSNYKRNVYALYASYGLQLAEKTRLNLNARETWATVAHAVQQNLSTAVENLSTGSTQRVDNSPERRFTPELQLVQQLREGESLYAKAGKSFRLPNLTQLYGSGALQSLPGLRPESGVHYELGYKKSGERDALRIALFKYALKDAISYKSGDSLLGTVEYDNKSLKNAGVELAYSVQHDARWRSQWGATWSNPQLGGSERSDADWVDVRSRYQLSGSVEYKEEKFSAQLAANFIGGLRGNDASETRFRPQLFTDAHFAYAPTQRVKLTLHINNLFDRRDLTNAGAARGREIYYYSAGRNFLLGCEYSF